MKMSSTSSRPPAFMLPWMKLPLIAYRLGISRIFGRLFVRVTHVGRKTGNVRHTMLAVMKFDAARKEICVVAPWNDCNWFKNITVTPALEVQTGRERFKPVQRFLEPDEIASLIENYRQQHPIVSRMMCRIPGWKWDSTHEEFATLARSLRGVAFQDQQGAGE